jgi:hypothetical protein
LEKHILAIEQRDPNQASFTFAKCPSMYGSRTQTRIGGIDIATPDAPLIATHNIEEKRPTNIPNAKPAEVARIQLDAEQVATQLPNPSPNRQSFIQLALTGILLLQRPQALHQFPHQGGQVPGHALFNLSNRGLASVPNGGTLPLHFIPNLAHLPIRPLTNGRNRPLCLGDQFSSIIRQFIQCQKIRIGRHGEFSKTPSS